MEKLVNILKEHQKKGDFDKNFSISVFTNILSKVNQLSQIEKKETQKYIKMLEILDLRMYRPKLSKKDSIYLKQTTNQIIKNLDDLLEKTKCKTNNPVNSPEQVPEETTNNENITSSRPKKFKEERRQIYSSIPRTGKINSTHVQKINPELRNTLKEIIVNLREQFYQYQMDSMLNAVVENYLSLTKVFPKLTILNMIMNILEKYGWDNNNFVMPPNRVELINDLDQILKQFS